MKNRIVCLFFVPLFLCGVLFSGKVWSESESLSKGGATSEQERLPETYLTFSARSFNAFIRDMRMIGEASSNPAFAAMIEGPIRFWTGPEVMKKADLDRQIGISFQKVPGTSDTLPLYYFPIGDTEVLMDFLTAKNEDMEFEILDDEILKWGEYYLRVKEGWSFMCQSEEQLALISRSPIEAIIEPMGDETFRIGLDYSKMPEGIREVFSRAVSEGVEVGLQQEEGESAEDFAKRKETAEEQLRYLNQVWDSLSEFNLTERVDPESKSVCFTMKIGLNPDSLLAEMMKKIEDVKPVFSEFAEYPGLLRGFGVSVEDERAKSFENDQFEGIRNEIRKYFNADSDSDVDKLLNELELLLKPVLEEVSSRTEKNYGILCDGSLGDMDLLLAFQLNELSRVREAAAKVTAFLKEKFGEDFDESWVKNEVSLKNGMNFFQITIPTGKIIDLAESQMKTSAQKNTKEERELLFRMIGDSLTFAVGGKENVCVVGFGNDPLGKLESLPANAPKSFEKVSDVRIDVRKFLEFVSKWTELYAESAEMALASYENDSQASELKSENDSTEESDVTESELIFDSELEESIEELGNSEEKDLEESMKQAKKTLRTIEVLLAMLEDAEKTDVRISAEGVSEGVEIHIDFEEGITRILGMLPSMFLFNAM